MKQKLAAFFALVLGVVFFLFRFEKGKRLEAESKLELADTEKKDAVISEKSNQVIEHNQGLKKELSRLVEVEKKLESGQELTPEEVELYWNGKKK